MTVENSTPVILRGINCSRLEYSQTGFSEPEFDEIADWGANLIRLPFNQQWALARPSYDPEPYLKIIDWVIEQAALRGMYTLLDLQWLDAISPRGTLKNGRVNFVPPLPTAASLSLWSQLAARYRNQPSVLFDIFNEPHDPLPDDPGECYGIRRVRMAQWQPWARRLIDAIRSQHPDALILVSGVDWGYDLAGFPLPGATNIVYSSHVYPGKKKSWEKAFGRLSESHPVFIAEFGGLETDLAWGAKLLEYLRARNIGWAAWSWSDHPHLLQSTSGFTPTPFGTLVRSALRNSRIA